jgi:ATP-dependent Zn protease
VIRLTSNQLVSALKVSLGGRNSSELATEYEEFFINNAEDIADLLKRMPKTASHTCTHFQAQQMVCSMIQVGVA